MPDSCYRGTELEVFAHATKWKSYVRSWVSPYLLGDVLEVGAGIGSATKLLCDGSQQRWVCLEPDSSLAERIKLNGSPRTQHCEVRIGTISELDQDEAFNTILYFDVLEHIQDDVGELARATKHLRPNGFLVVLAPALPWLFTPFDAAIGHFRRYTRKSLRAIAPPSLREERCVYLDSIGLLASAGNRVLLKSAAPTVAQIRFWDTFLVPLSRFADRVSAFSLGRSVLAIWRLPLMA